MTQDYEFVSATQNLQGRIYSWRCEAFTRDQASELLMSTGGVCEEAGELMRAVRKQMQGIRGTHEEWAKEQEKEAADVFIQLCSVASEAGFNLGRAIVERFKEVQARDVNHNPVGSSKPV